MTCVCVSSYCGADEMCPVSASLAIVVYQTSHSSRLKEYTFLSVSSFFCGLVLWGWGLRTDRVSIALTWPCIFHRNKNDNIDKNNVVHV